ncbi:MAG: phosphatidate cytidylyltransferase [Opitutales bacterium]
MKQRIYSFTLLWLGLLALLLVFGIHAGVFLVAALAFFTQLELYQLFEKMGLRPVKAPGLAFGALIVFGSYYLDNPDSGNDLFLLSFLALTLTIIQRDLQAGRLRSFMPTLFGLLFVPYLLHFLLKVVTMAEQGGEGTATGIFLSIWIIAVAKCTDVGGLLIGSRIGKTPLSAVSPKKSYEGAVGGVLVSILAGILAVLIFHPYAPANFSWWLAALMALPIAFASIASDLVESAFKRQAGVKDSGHLVPGIGGVFDLADSLILSAPLGYLLFKYFLF